MSKTRSSSSLTVLLRFNRREAWLFRLAGVCSAIAAGAIVLQAYSLSRLLACGVIERLPPSRSMLCLLILALSGRALADHGRERLARRASSGMRQRLRFDLFDRLSARPLQAAERPGGVGAAVTGLCEQVEAMDGYLARYRPQMANAALTPALLSAAALPVEPAAAAILLATVPLAPLFLALIGKRTQMAQDRQMADLTRMGGYFLERLRGLGTLRLLGRAEEEAERIGKVAQDFRRKSMTVLKYAFLSSAALEFFASLGIAAVAVTIGQKLLTPSGALDAGGLQTGLFVLILAPEFYLPLRQLAAAYHDRATALSAAEALTRQFPPPPDRDSVTDAQAILPTPPFSVTLQNVYFRHPDSQQPLLHDIAAQFHPGERIALLGPSGSGKSTLMALLFGLLSPERGQIRIGDLERSQASLAQWQRAIAWQGQSPHLFHGTIRDNLALADPDADDGLLAAIAARVGLSQMLAELPLGWRTPIGEGGVGLSGGQAQQLALGRCLLKPAGLVLLDEPTAHLDRDTERALLDLLMRQPRDRIYILATHSNEVARRMDRALTLQEGRLVAA